MLRYIYRFKTAAMAFKEFIDIERLSSLELFRLTSVSEWSDGSAASTLDSAFSNSLS